MKRLCTKERINERELYISVKCSCGNKQNKLMRALPFGRMVVHKRKNKWKRTIYFVPSGELRSDIFVFGVNQENYEGSRVQDSLV